MKKRQQLDPADTFCLYMTGFSVVMMLVVAALTHERNPQHGRPVSLYYAVPTAKACGSDWLCLLEREHYINKAKGA